jgi:glutamate carboxypeptidase
MAIDGLGMSGTGGHTVDETGLMSSLPNQSKRAALMIYRLYRDGMDSARP